MFVNAPDGVPFIYIVLPTHLAFKDAATGKKGIFRYFSDNTEYTISVNISNRESINADFLYGFGQGFEPNEHQILLTALPVNGKFLIDDIGITGEVIVEWAYPAELYNWLN